MIAETPGIQAACNTFASRSAFHHISNEGNEQHKFEDARTQLHVLLRECGRKAGLIWLIERGKTPADHGACSEDDLRELLRDFEKVNRAAHGLNEMLTDELRDVWRTIRQLERRATEAR